jgi:hypothetical protein
VQYEQLSKPQKDRLERFFDVLKLTGALPVVALALDDELNRDGVFCIRLTPVLGHMDLIMLLRGAADHLERNLFGQPPPADPQPKASSAEVHQG